MAKFPKKRYFIVILIIIGYVILFVDLRSPHKRHFDFELSDNSSLIRYEQNRAGFSDWSYALVYSKDEKDIVEKIIQAWDLKPKFLYKDNPYHKWPTSFMAVWNPKPEWWPDWNELNAIEVSYMRTNVEEERYWSLWVPENEDVIYVERGNW